MHSVTLPRCLADHVASVHVKAKPHPSPRNCRSEGWRAPCNNRRRVPRQGFGRPTVAVIPISTEPTYYAAAEGYRRGAVYEEIPSEPTTTTKIRIAECGVPGRAGATARTSFT